MLLLLPACVGIGNMGELPLDGGRDPEEPAIRPSDGGDEDSGQQPVEDAEQGPADAERPEEDAEPPPVEDAEPPPCAYPAGPYAFNHGRVSPPMSWPYATALGGEGEPADFEGFHCDEEVRSVFVYVGNTT